MKREHSGNPPATQLRPERIRAVLEDYFSPLPDRVEDEVWKYMNLLDLWSQKVSLTSIHDQEHVVRFHFGESIFGLSLMGEGPNGRLADVGSGAGFPGLALKLAAPELKVILIEPNKKKSAFLHEVIRRLSVNGADVASVGFKSARIEEGSLSFVTCRALRGHRGVLEWANGKLGPGGCVLLWLGREDSKEIARGESWIWDEPILIPRTEGRFILRGTPAV